MKQMKKHVFMLNKMKTAINCKNSLFYQSIALTGINQENWRII